jgi:hypothetical protein
VQLLVAKIGVRSGWKPTFEGIKIPQDLSGLAVSFYSPPFHAENMKRNGILELEAEGSNFASATKSQQESQVREY